MAFDESNRMNSAYFTIHPCKNPMFSLKHWFYILQFSNSAWFFIKLTGCHYINYPFSRTLVRMRPHVEIIEIWGCWGLLYHNPRWFTLIILAISQIWQGSQALTQRIVGSPYHGPLSSYIGHQTSYIVIVDRRRTQLPWPSPTLGSFESSHRRHHKS